MLITGCAMPFRVDILSENQKVQFSTGAFRNILTRQTYVECVVNHVWKEHLASTVHGLTLWENFAGLYFRAQLPDTVYAKSIYAAVIAHKITSVCALSTETDSEQYDGVLIIREARLFAVNLLISAPAHCPQAWISWGGPPAEERIAREAKQAEQRHLWALDDKISSEQMFERMGTKELSA